jgi:hypothetical protein
MQKVTFVNGSLFFLLAFICFNFEIAYAEYMYYIKKHESNELEEYSDLFYEEENPLKDVPSVFCTVQDQHGTIFEKWEIKHPRMQKKALGRMIFDRSCIIFGLSILNIGIIGGTILELLNPKSQYHKILALL